MKRVAGSGAWWTDYARGTFISWDFFMAAGCGVIAFVLGTADAIADDAVTILIAEAAIGVAITSTVLAGLAIFATFFDSGYRRALELAGGIRRALMPYVVVIAVAGIATVFGVLAGLAAPATDGLGTALLLGVSTLVSAWAVAGAVSLGSLTAFHAQQRAHLMAGADEAARIRAKRLRELRPGAKSGPGGP